MNIVERSIKSVVIHIIRDKKRYGGSNEQSPDK